jgi:hypothetical protein
MTNDELEQRLRAWYRAEMGEREPAPPALYASLAAIPETMPAKVRSFGGRRGFLVLAASGLLLTLLIGATIAIGSGLLPPPWTVDEEAPALIDEQSLPAAPSPTPGPARTYVCPDMDAFAELMGAVSGPGWPNAADPVAEPGPGAIAGWDDSGAHLVLVDPRTGTETPVLDEVPTDGPHALAGSPDGQTLAIALCELFVMVDGELHRPTPGLQATETFQWSPDSSRIAMLTFQGADEFIVLVHQDGAPIVDLGSPCDGCRIGGDPLWSPDGSRLAVEYLDRDGASAGVAFVDSGGGGWTVQPMSQPVPIVTGWLDDGHLVALAWGSDGIAEGDRPAWVSISADAADEIQPLDLRDDPAADAWARQESATTRGLLFSPDRSLIAFVSRGDGGGPLAPQEVSIVDLASGDDRVVWSGDPTAGAWAVWSPDSSAVAITTFTHAADTQGVWIVNADGSELRRIRDEPFEAMSWQAAGAAATER